MSDGSRTVRLSRQSLLLLWLLVRHQGRLVADSLIIDTLWEDDAEGAPLTARSIISINIMHLRRALATEAEPDPIERASGLGYRLRPGVAVPEQWREPADVHRSASGDPVVDRLLREANDMRKQLDTTLALIAARGFRVMHEVRDEITGARSASDGGVGAVIMLEEEGGR